MSQRNVGINSKNAIKQERKDGLIEFKLGISVEAENDGSASSASSRNASQLPHFLVLSTL